MLTSKCCGGSIPSTSSRTSTVVVWNNCKLILHGHGLVQVILFPQFGDDVGQQVTVVYVTGGVLGGCCQVTEKASLSSCATAITLEGHGGTWLGKACLHI